MPTFVEMATMATTAIKLASDLRNIDQGLAASEAKLKIADLMSQLADLKIGISELRADSEGKDAELVELRKAFAFKGETVEVRGFHFETRDGKPVGEPFCPICLSKGKFYRLTWSRKPGRPYTCQVCPAEYSNAPAYLWSDQRGS